MRLTSKRELAQLNTLVVLVVVLLLGGVGCMRKNPTQNINAVALAYMEQRYGEKFEYVAPWGNSMSGTHELLVECVSLPGQKILVQVENYKKADKLFLDNYLAVKYYQETVDFIRDSATSEYASVSVFYDVFKDGLSPELSPDATFAEFLSDPRLQFAITIEVKASDFVSEDQTEKIAELIAKYGTHYWLSVVFVEDSQYGTFDEKTIGEAIVLNNFVCCAQITNLDDNIRIEWTGKE
jgi:hypothetical protein